MPHTRLVVALLVSSLLFVTNRAQAKEEQPKATREERLFKAAATDNILWATALLEDGADVNTTNDQGETPLHLAVASSMMVVLLLDRGADAARQDKQGNTPMHRAAEQGFADSVEMLMLFTPLAIENNAGFTVRDLAERSGNQKSINILEQRNAPHGRKARAAAEATISPPDSAPQPATGAEPQDESQPSDESEPQVTEPQAEPKPDETATAATEEVSPRALSLEELQLGPVRPALNVQLGVDTNPYRINTGGLNNDGNQAPYLSPHAFVKLVPAVMVKLPLDEFVLGLDAQLDYRALAGLAGAAGASREVTSNSLIAAGLLQGEVQYANDPVRVLVLDTVNAGIAPGRFVDVQGAPLPIGAALYGESIARLTNTLATELAINLGDWQGDLGGSLWLGRYTQHGVVNSTGEIAQIFDPQRRDVVAAAGLAEAGLGGLVADSYLRMSPGLMGLFVEAGVGYSSFANSRDRDLPAHFGFGIRQDAMALDRDMRLFVGWEVPDLPNVGRAFGTLMLQGSLGMLDLNWLSLHSEFSRRYAASSLYELLVQNHVALKLLLHPRAVFSGDLSVGAGVWQVDWQRYPQQALSVARPTDLALDPYLFGTLGVELHFLPLVKPRLEATLEWYQCSGVSDGPSYRAAAGVPLSFVRAALSLGVRF